MSQDTTATQSARIEELVREVEHLGEPASSLARELVQAVLAFHRDGLARVLEKVSAAPNGAAVVGSLAGDELVGALLVLHDLHPSGLEERIHAAIARVRPHLAAHGGDLELVSISESEVRLRWLGSCRGCPSSAATMAGLVEVALREAAPDLRVVLDTAEPAAPAAGGFVPLGSVKRSPAVGARS